MLLESRTETYLTFQQAPYEFLHVWFKVVPFQSDVLFYYTDINSIHFIGELYKQLYISEQKNLF